MSQCDRKQFHSIHTSLFQDGAGGIWKLDISVSLTKKAPELIESYHSGPIKKLVPCPYTHMVASIGADGGVRVFDYLQKKTLVYQKYKPGGSCMIWANRIIDSRMGTLIAGFSDGVIRVINLEYGDQESPFDLKMVLQYVHKPHTGEVTAIVVDDEGDEREERVREREKERERERERERFTKSTNGIGRISE